MNSGVDFRIERAPPGARVDWGPSLILLTIIVALLVFITLLIVRGVKRVGRWMVDRRRGKQDIWS